MSFKMAFLYFQSYLIIFHFIFSSEKFIKKYSSRLKFDAKNGKFICALLITEQVVISDQKNTHIIVMNATNSISLASSMEFSLIFSIIHRIEQF